MQGALELLWRLERALCEITGMARATLQPPGGRVRRDDGAAASCGRTTRTGATRGAKVIIPDSAHGTNPASVASRAIEAVPVPSDARGLVDVEALAKLVDEDVAGLMLTNPNTLGLFEQDIGGSRRRSTASAGSCTTTARTSTRSWAGAGRATWGSTSSTSTRTRRSRPRTAAEGPGAGPVGVNGGWCRSCPCPTSSASGRPLLLLEHDRPARSAACTGSTATSAILVRAYTYVFLHGRDGLREVSDRAVLNANYLAALVRGRFPLAYPGHRPDARVRRDGEAAERETGIRAMDVAKRVIDLGFHPSTVYFPLVVEEAMMVEPTETESKATLDAFAAALLQAASEATASARTILREAPVTTPVGRLDEARAARHLILRW